MRLPTFIIIGVQKAGTTSIYNYLKQHPQVYMSSVKEPHFLERDWDQFYAEGGAPKPSRIDTFEKYTALFEGVTDELAIGEASANCLFHYDKSIPQISKYVPDAQIVVVLRHPAERAHSDYLMHLRDCINPGTQRSLSEQVRHRAEKSYIVRKGYYCEGIQQFREAFGAEKVKVFLYDDLRKSAVSFMQTVYQAVGVDATFEPDVGKRSQTAQVPKNKAVNSLLRRQNPLRSSVAAGLKLVMPDTMRQQLRDSLIRWNSSGKDAMPLSPEDRAALIDLYREDILKLQDLLQRDLSAWLV
ncbi:MAG: sulfotransferase [Leptolyngbya sp. SIO1E4]|nr:sulfotransferase [Leptolyngbya sp. SIO1E4]